MVFSLLQMAVSVRGLYFVITLFLGSFFGSIFMLGPVLPLLLLSPAWYRWITDRIVATWLTLPVVRTLIQILTISFCFRLFVLFWIYVYIFVIRSEFVIADFCKTVSLDVLNSVFPPFLFILFLLMKHLFFCIILVTLLILPSPACSLYFSFFF